MRSRTSLQVLTVHGLGRSPLSMFWLARALRRAGHTVEHFGYVAAAERYDRMVERLRDHLRRLTSRGPYAIVAHSFGGVLTRAALAGATFPLPGHVVMLGTPNRRARMAEWGVRLAPWRWLTGEGGRRLADPRFFETLPPLEAPCTLIAGTRGLHWRWLPLSGEVNDGLVGLEETRLGDDDPVVALPAGHSFMMSKRIVHRAVLQALEGASNST